MSLSQQEYRVVMRHPLRHEERPLKAGRWLESTWLPKERGGGRGATIVFVGLLTPNFRSSLPYTTPWLSNKCKGKHERLIQRHSTGIPATRASSSLEIEGPRQSEMVPPEQMVPLWWHAPAAGRGYCRGRINDGVGIGSSGMGAGSFDTATGIFKWAYGLFCFT